MKTAGIIDQNLSMAKGVFLLADTDGTALYANPVVEQRTGFSIGEIIGKAPGKLWGGHMPRTFYDRFWKAIEEKGDPFVAMITNMRKDKAKYPELLAVAPLGCKDAGAPEYFLALQMGHLREQDGRERFEREFKKIFSRRSGFSEEEKLQFLFQALDSDFQTPHLAGQSLAEAFRETLIAPFEERFKARKEDRLLIMAAQADPKAFQVLYEKYRHQVFLYFIRHVEGNDDVAEDLAQDTFYRALRYLKNFRLTNASYGTYLLRVAHSVLINHFRKKQFLALMEDAAEDKPVETCLLPEDALWRSPKLSVIEQRILVMKYQEGFSVQEIATALNKTENAVKLRLSRARKKLRSALEA